jgi:CheY-like chemotaxis protein
MQLPGVVARFSFMEPNSRNLILIVDDSKDNQELLELLLVSKGYRVHCASNGEEALYLLKEFTILPDLILLDAQMPVMDGYEFRIEQKKIERLKNIPVLVMSGDEDSEMSKKMIEPQGILIKPLHVKSFIDSVTSFLGNFAKV